MKEIECLRRRQHGLYALGDGMALLPRSVRSSVARPHCSRRGDPGAVLPSPGRKMQEMWFSFQFSSSVPRNVAPKVPTQSLPRCGAVPLCLRSAPGRIPVGLRCGAAPRRGPQQYPLPRAAAPDVCCAAQRCNASRRRCRGDVGPHHHSPHHAPKKMLFALLG